MHKTSNNFLRLLLYLKEKGWIENKLQHNQSIKMEYKMRLNLDGFFPLLCGDHYIIINTSFSRLLYKKAI